MTQNELAEMYGIKPKKDGLKNKNKAKEIVGKIAKCPKCGELMKWIEGTNVCVCETCVKLIGSGDSAYKISLTKEISDKSRKFLESNYSSVLKNIQKEKAEKESEGVTNNA